VLRGRVSVAEQGGSDDGTGARYLGIIVLLSVNEVKDDVSLFFSHDGGRWRVETVYCIATYCYVYHRHRLTDMVILTGVSIG
jgi:hypothetical protein